MREILHIFKKDVRHHWPEILVSLAFLCLYVWVTFRNPGRSAAFAGGFSWFFISAESIPPLMVLFWMFLTVRVVQGESLIGDRQWWVTKPYEWWKLLAAKELFLIVLIGLPLFSVQLYLLHHAGFSAISRVPGVLEMQFALGLTLFLPSIALGGLTRNLWQAMLALILVFVAISTVVSLLQKVPNLGMSSTLDGLEDGLIGLLLLASVIGAVGWQYALRKTWTSRGVLLSGPALCLLLAVVVPYKIFIEQKYPLVEMGAAPAHFIPAVVNPISKKGGKPRNFLSSIYLRIPLSVSGILPGHVVQIDGARTHISASNTPSWDPGWKREWTKLWAESQGTDISFEMKDKDFDSRKAQTVQLHLELALTEYQEAEPRDLTLKEGNWTDQRLGICHLDDRNLSQIDCLRPFLAPGGTVSFDPSAAKCIVPPDADQPAEDAVSHHWLGAHNVDYAFSPGLNPVAEYEILFGPRAQLSLPAGIAKQKTKRVYLCPGAKVRFAQPEEKNHVRVTLEMDGIRLEDLALRSEFDLNE